MPTETTTPTPSPEAEALPTLPVVAEEDTFEVWFEQYRMQTWLSAGCHKDRGPEPSAAWGLGSRQSLLRGWLARAALSQAPAEAAIVALRAEVERLTMQIENLSAESQLAYKVSENVGRNALQCAQDLLQDKLALTAEVAELRKERDAAMAEVQELAWHRDPWISVADQVPQGREPVIVISRGWDKPKVLSYEIRILKDGPWERFIDNDTGRWYWYPERMHWMHLADYDDLKEDGASLLGGGGTL